MTSLGSLLIMYILAHSYRSSLAARAHLVILLGRSLQSRASSRTALPSSLLRRRSVRWDREVPSHIDCDDEVRDTSVEEHFTARDLHIDHPTVLLLMFPEHLCRIMYSFV